MTMTTAPRAAACPVKLRSNRTDLRAEYLDPFAGIEKIRLRGGLTDYQHQEIEGGEVGTTFKNRGYDLRLEAQHKPVAGWRGVVGMQTSTAISARTARKPSCRAARRAPTASSCWRNTSWPTGASSWARARTGRRFRPGRRAAQQPVGHLAVGGSHLELRAGVFGGIVAVALAAPADRAGALRQGRATTNTYEIGNAGLGRETSHNIDLTLRKHSGATTFSASVFHNRVKNYIYANTLDRYEDFRLIEYTQRDAEFTGVEGELRHQFTPVFSAAVFGDYVRGKLTGGDGNLPRIPAARAGLRGNFKWQQWSAGVEYARVFSQKDIAAYENNTPGYNLVNAVVAYRGNYGSTGYEVYLRGTNLLNRLAYNHASFISSVAPLPGRSVLLGMRLTY